METRGSGLVTPRIVLGLSFSIIKGSLNRLRAMTDQSTRRTKHHTLGDTSGRNSARKTINKTEKAARRLHSTHASSPSPRAGSIHARECSFNPKCTIERNGQTVRTPATSQCDSCTKWFCSTHIGTHGCSESQDFASSFAEIPLDLGS